MPAAADGMESPALRSLPSCSLPGAWQMAIDAWLLEQVIQGERQGPLLRFYRWSEPTLSLGRHQRSVDPRWTQLAEDGHLKLARRPSGGSAVLHGGDLTYALIWPTPPRRRREAYHLSCRWLQEAFAAMDLPLLFGDAPCRSDQVNCFASSTTADLVHSGGAKRIGSAQLWRSHALLQHGSIAIHPDGALWEVVFATAPPCLPPLPFSGEKLEAHLLNHALRWFPYADGVEPQQGSGSLISDPLESWEWERVRSNLGFYEVRGLAASDSAVSARDLATGSRDNPRG